MTRIRWLLALSLLVVVSSQAPAVSATSSSDVGVLEQALLTQEQAKFLGFLWETQLGDHLFALGSAFGLPRIEMEVCAMPEEMAETLLNMLESRYSWDEQFPFDFAEVTQGALTIEYCPDGTNSAELVTPTGQRYFWVRTVPKTGLWGPLPGLATEGGAVR